MSRALSLVVAALVALLSPLAAAASQDAPPPERRAVTVATRAVPPFAWQDEAGVWRGLAIDVWTEVAARLDLETTYVERGLAEMLGDVEDGRVDAAAAALTVTAERERVMDFGHPFLSSGLGIAVAAGGDPGLGAVLVQLASAEFLGVVLTLGGLLLVCGFLVWLFERRSNPEQFEPGLRGVGSGFWWSAVTMTTVGYGDKAPATLGGRLVGLIWMFASIVVISGFTAAIASSLTVGRLGARIQGPEDLPGFRVGTIEASTGAAWTARRSLGARAFDSAEDALAALVAGELDAVVYDAPVLRHLIRVLHNGRAAVLPARVERQDYAVALPSGSDLREEVDRAVLVLTASPEWEAMLERYLGE